MLKANGFTHTHRRRTALAGIVLGALALMLLVQGGALGAGTARAAVTEGVKLSIPEPGQLSIARLEFKVKGVAKPKIKVKAENADELPEGVIGVAQAARYTKKKGRAVALVAIANPALPASASAATGARGGSPVQLALEVKLTQARKANVKELGIKFDDNPRLSHNFVGVLGAESAAQRELGQEMFDLEAGELPDDEFGAFDLNEALKFIRLNLGTLTVIRQVTIYRNVLLESALAALLGPPAALDAGVYGFVTGRPPPRLTQANSAPSPANPSVVFIDAEWNIPVMGVQISQSSDNTVLHTADARCENGFFNPGTVAWGPGPFLGLPGMSYRLDCDLPQDTPRVFFDVSMAQPPASGAEVFKALPIPFYGDDQLHEAVAAEASSYLVKF